MRVLHLPGIDVCVRRLVGVLLLIAICAACGPKRPLLGVAEFPPTLADTPDQPANGGRTYAVAVSPVDRERIFVSTQWGGLWRTVNGGRRWIPVTSLLSVFPADVAWSNDGRRVIATLSRDNQTENGGGIWVSSDGGETWSRPASAVPPAHPAVPLRINARAISFAPAPQGRVYVATDFGIAISDDAGTSWRHVALEATPVAAHSVLALPNDGVVALSSVGMHRSSDGGRTWMRVRSGDFSSGFNYLAYNLDVPTEILFYEDMNNLFLYKADAGTFTKIPIHETVGFNYRAPFVKVGRESGGVVVWAGVNNRLGRVKIGSGGVSAIDRIRQADWTLIGEADGVHTDSGDLGLDGAGHPVLFGSDGGIFRPTNDEGTKWTHAGTGLSGWNSLQISDLGGTNREVFPGVFRNSLIFATQDNFIWGSSDGGLTWPNNECMEGFHVEVTTDALASQTVRAAYSVFGGRSGCDGSHRFSDEAVGEPRIPVPDLDESGRKLEKFGAVFRVQGDGWIRLRTGDDGHQEIWVSTSNGERWRKRYDLAKAIQVKGAFQCAGRALSPIPTDSGPRCYLPVTVNDKAPNGIIRIGLIRLARPLESNRITNVNESNIQYLPNNGSLGERVTESEWQAVFGVHPQNFRLQIAPDIVNGAVFVSRDEGVTWTRDDNATNQVTRNGRYIMYDEDPRRMLVTHVAFDPYNSDRYVLGTRESGVVVTDDGGRSWRTVRWSEPLLQATGFVFKHDETVIASSFGRGLWVIDLRHRPRATSPVFVECVVCRFLDVRTGRRIVDIPRDWDTFVAYNGFITGAHIRLGRLRAVNISSATTRVARFLDVEKPTTEIPVVAKDYSAELRHVVKGLEPGEYVKGFAFNGNHLMAVVVGTEPFHAAGPAEAPPDDGAQDPDEPLQNTRPYVTVLADLVVSGNPIVRAGEEIRIAGGAFAPGLALTVQLDGVAMECRSVAPERDGTFLLEIGDSAELKDGPHTVEVVQGDADATRTARSRFLTTAIDADEADDADDADQAESQRDQHRCARVRN